MSGTLYGIGVGPGDPELMTLKAVRLITEADCIVLPGENKDKCRAYGIASKVVTEIDNKELLFIPFPMKMDKERLETFHKSTAMKIEEKLDEGKMVCFLTIGDPSIYSTMMYVKEIIDADGYKCELVSGVTSFCAAASRLGISLGQGDTPINIIPGSYLSEDTLNMPGTRVFMKSGKKINELIEELVNEKGKRDSDIFYVSNCGMSDEKVGSGIESLSGENGYLTVVIAVDR